MPRKARQLQSGLLAKGFRYLDSRHRKLTYYTLSGKPTPVSTLLSHGPNRDVGDRVLSQMSRQCGLSRREFDRLVDCSMSQQQYEALLVERDRI